ncbi:MAG: HAD-IC family P-type ATPase, partial [Bowdeniella nasicola]|nr:HAD-IC family P-type ATPase [Bowdeniella nasicola]
MSEITNPSGNQRSVDLAITGMTCAACVARVEKKLNKLPGVTANVNLAMETARVNVTGDTSDADLIARVENAGYGARVLPASSGIPTRDTSDPQTARAANLRRRFLLALGCSIPVMVISMVPAWQFVGWQWVVAALALPVVTWAAWPFHRAAATAARHGSSTMDTLVSLGVIAATTWSLWALIFGGAGKLGMTMDMTFMPRAHHDGAVPELYFEAATMVTTFLLAGRWAESRSRHRAGQALREVLALGAKTATRINPDGSEMEVAADQLRIGDTVLVRPGEKIPCDGTITTGHAAVDESMVSGESIPVDKASGDQAIAGTIALTGALHITATRVGNDTTVAHIGKLVAEAQAEKAPIQRLADRVASVFVPIVVALALLTFSAWWLLGGEL